MPGASSVYRPCASGFGALGCASAQPTIEAAKAAVMNLIVKVDRKLKSEDKTTLLLLNSFGTYIFIRIQAQELSILR
jgi:hypothetical protein